MKDFFKKHKILIVIISLILALALSAVVVYFLLFKDANHDNSILFYQNGNLMLFQENGKDAIVVDDEFQEEFLSAVFSPDNNFIAYYNDEDLYLYNILTKSKVKIGSEINSYDFIFSSNSAYIFYITESNVYAYNINKASKEKVANIEDDTYASLIFATENDLYYVISYDDGLRSIYSYNFKGKKVDKIASNVSGYAVNEQDFKFLYQIEDEEELYEDLHVFDAKKNKDEKKLTNIANRYFVKNDEFTKFLYLRKSENPVNFIIDDEENNDPVKTTKEKELCTYYNYLDGYCTFEEYWNDEYVYIERTSSKKSTNDQIRAYLKKVDSFDLYLYENGKETLIDHNVNFIDEVNDDFDIFVYSKYDVDENKKISEFTSFNEFEKYFDNNYSLYYKKKNENAIRVADGLCRELIGQTRLTKDYVYYVTDESTKLYAYNIATKETTKLLEGEDIYLVGDTKYGMVYEEYIEKNDKSKAYLHNGNVVEIADNVYDIDYDKETDKIMFYNNCGSYSCDLSFYDGEVQTLFEDINWVYPLSSGNYYVFKNYSKASNTNDLYYYKGNDMIQIAYDIPSGLVLVND